MSNPRVRTSVPQKSIMMALVATIWLDVLFVAMSDEALNEDAEAIAWFWLAVAVGTTGAMLAVLGARERAILCDRILQGMGYVARGLLMILLLLTLSSYITVAIAMVVGLIPVALLERARVNIEDAEMEAEGATSIYRRAQARHPRFRRRSPRPK